MKRIFSLVLALLLFLPFFSGFAEEETASALYPVRENGLWGYVNRAGEVAIEPRYADAKGFRGGYALVYPVSDGPETERGSLCGIIDAPGEWVLPPAEWDILETDNYGRYIGGRDEGIYILWSEDKTGRDGFFDIPSGFFSGLIYDWVDGEWVGNVDAELACVEIDGLKGFVRRSTGESAIPCRYDPTKYYNFHGNYCVVKAVNTAFYEWTLIDRSGREIPMPDNCYAASVPLSEGDLESGLIPVREILAENGDNLYGDMDLNGNIVIAPQYTDAASFSEGLALVELSSGGSAVITPENEVVFVLPEDILLRRSDREYRHGLLKLAHCNEDDQLTYMAFVDRTGKEAFRLEIQDLFTAETPWENGTDTALYFTGTPAANSYNLFTEVRCGLFNARGEILTPPVFTLRDIEERLEFSEGLLPIIDADTGKTGYINDCGLWVIPPQYDDASSFRDGLALVEKDGKLMYIDHSGAVVWEER